MPSLRALLDFAVDTGHLEPEHVERLELAIRQQWPGERCYLPPPDSRKNPDRAQRIRDLSKHLPTRVVASRAGCSESYVRRIARQK